MTLSMTKRAESGHVLIRRLIRNDKLPKPDTLFCIDFCGKKASEYDHYAGYQEKDLVHPVCHSCHLQREGARGAWRRKNKTCPKGHNDFILVRRRDSRCVSGFTIQRVCRVCYPYAREVER